MSREVIHGTKVIGMDIKKYNQAISKIERLEKDLEYAYFSNSKKRYYGIERDTEKKYIKGMNIIRKDAPKFIKEQLKKKFVKPTGENRKLILIKEIK